MKKPDGFEQMAPAMKVDPDDVTPQVKPHVPEGSPVERVKAVYWLVEQLAENGIAAMEVLHADLPGDEKREKVTDQVLQFIQSLEDRYDLLPGMIEGPAFLAIRFGAEWLVERAYQRMKADGAV